MLFSDITILDKDFEPREHCYVGVRDGRIAYVGATEPKEDFGSVYRGQGKLLMPAFYNAHSHSAMTLLRGYAENMNLQDWLNTKIFPFEAKMKGEDIYAGVMLAMAESVRSGIVSSTDMYYWLDDAGRAVAASGCKMNMSNAVLCFGGSAFEELPAYRIACDAYRDWHGAAGGRILTDLALHAEYTSTEKVARGLAALAAEQGVNLHIHASETKSETDGCLERHGKTPVAYLADCGLLDQPATLGHCVWVTEEDMDILREKGATAAACPVSNSKLASGIANVPRLLEKGVNVALGTDGVSSNNSLNMLADAKVMALEARIRTGDPAVLTPKQILHSMTRAGALSQGRTDCGLLQEGFKADLLVLDIDKPNMQPVHSLLNNVVWSADSSNICLTMCDGQVLYKDGEYLTIDVEKAIAEADACRRKILEML
ncbi:MAG: amidohydrolase [Clostridia bacterium]|nr:amidohydrolase [Clostridia bacterium]